MLDHLPPFSRISVQPPLLSSNNPLNHGRRLTELRNLLLHRRLLVARVPASSALQHGLLLFIVVATAEDAAEECLDGGLAGRLTVVMTGPDLFAGVMSEPVEGLAAFGGEADDTAVDVADADEGEGCEGDGGHAGDYDEVLVERRLEGVSGRITGSEEGCAYRRWALIFVVRRMVVFVMRWRLERMFVAAHGRCWHIESLTMCILIMARISVRRIRGRGRKMRRGLIEKGWWRTVKEVRIPWRLVDGRIIGRAVLLLVAWRAE